MVLTKQYPPVLNGNNAGAQSSKYSLAQEVIDTSGFWTHPANGQDFPTLQHIAVRELMAGHRPNLPTALAPYISAQRGIEFVDQGKLFG